MVTAKATAKGLHKGEKVVIECIEYGELGEENEKDLRVKVLKNGKEDEETSFLFDMYVSFSYTRRAKLPHCYNPQKNSAEAYWLVMHEEYFDEPPEITIEGNVNTFGSPYTDEDLTGVYF